MTRADQMVHTARHLTPHEIDRLLARYDLAEAAREAILQDLYDEMDAAMEYFYNALAEGRALAATPLTAYERYLKTNPLYTAAPMPQDWGRVWPEDEVPF